MNSVKSTLENFESLSNNVKKDILLYGDSRLDGNKTDSSLLKITHPWTNKYMTNQINIADLHLF